jgi:hypothetical protein
MGREVIQEGKQRVRAYLLNLGDDALAIWHGLHFIATRLNHAAFTEESWQHVTSPSFDLPN